MTTSDTPTSKQIRYKSYLAKRIYQSGIKLNAVEEKVMGTVPRSRKQYGVCIANLIKILEDHSVSLEGAITMPVQPKTETTIEIRSAEGKTVIIPKEKKPNLVIKEESALIYAYPRHHIIKILSARIRSGRTYGKRFYGGA